MLIFDSGNLDREMIFFYIPEKRFKCLLNNREGDVVPGYIAFEEQVCFEAFRAHPKLALVEVAAVKHIHLVDIWNIKNSIQLQVTHARSRFLPSFSGGTRRGGLTVFHETSGQCPVILARLYGSLTK